MSGEFGDSPVEEFKTSPYVVGQKQPGNRCREEHTGCKPLPEAQQVTESWYKEEQEENEEEMLVSSKLLILHKKASVIPTLHQKKDIVAVRYMMKENLIELIVNHLSIHIVTRTSYQTPSLYKTSTN